MVAGSFTGQKRSNDAKVKVGLSRSISTPAARASSSWPSNENGWDGSQDGDPRIAYHALELLGSVPQDDKKPLGQRNTYPEVGD